MIIHNTRMTNKIYTRLQDLIRILSSESIDIFRDIFDHWQWYYKLISRSKLDEKDDIIEKEIKILINDKKINKIIKEIYKTSFKWRNEKQEKIIKIMMKNINSLIMILSTNVGKNLIFIFLMIFNNIKMIIIIISLKILINNLLK